MNFIHIGIYSKEEDYPELLAVKLSRAYPRFIFTILNDEQLKDYRIREKLDILLIDGLKEQLKGKYIGLVRQESEIVIDEEGLEFKLLKYGHTGKLAGQILYLYSLITGAPNVLIKDRSSRRIIVTSLKGGSGATTVCTVLGGFLSSLRGFKVLYLSLSDYLHFEEDKQVMNLDRFLCHYALNKESATQVMSYLLKDEKDMYRFNTALGLNPLAAMDKQELSSFLDHVESYSDFDYMLIDLGSKAGLIDNELLNNLHKILLIVKEGHNEGTKRVIDQINGKLPLDHSDKIMVLGNLMAYSEFLKLNLEVPSLFIEENNPHREEDLLLSGDFYKNMKILMKDLT
ncbi:MAG: hypothetical protein WC961_06145 [Anaerovoracaceae bacterium]|nr:hypothetical protein [Clostridiales bacterium]